MSKGESKLLHKGAAAFFHDEIRENRLMDALSYTFINRSLLQTALTHPALNAKRNNQRLEFLGDAVLQLVISQALFELHKEKEGKLTFRRQKLVNEAALARVALGLRLSDYLYLDASLLAQGGQDNPAILADSMEAVLAAIYLDGGLEKAREVILSLWDKAISSADGELDAKTSLQEMLQKSGQEEPAYLDISATGPAHDRLFTVAVLYKGEELARGTGKTKRQAQQEAAGKALIQVQQGEPS